MNYHFLVGFYTRLTEPTALSFYLDHEENENYQQGVRAADEYLTNPRNNDMTEIEEVAMSIHQTLKEPPTDPQDALRIVFGLMDDTPAIVRAVAEALWERCREESEQQPECGCCGQTAKCDDDCDAVVLRKAGQNPAPDELSDYDRGFKDGKLDRLVDEVLAESALVEALEAIARNELDAQLAQHVAAAALSDYLKQAPSHDD